MRIPGAEDAVIDIEKLRDYCLAEQHPYGRHKARLFASIAGLQARDAQTLRTRLLEMVASCDATELPASRHGRKFTIEAEMEVPAGRVLIRSAWIVRDHESFPRFVTCYPVKSRKRP